MHKPKRIYSLYLCSVIVTAFYRAMGRVYLYDVSMIRIYVWKVLVERRRNDRTTTWYIGRPYFSAKGHEAVVKLLLDKGVDINAQDWLYGNALQAASAKGHEAVVQLLLLSKEADKAISTTKNACHSK
jgi:hypothetical protein